MILDYQLDAMIPQQLSFDNNYLSMITHYYKSNNFQTFQRFIISKRLSLKLNKEKRIVLKIFS